MIDAPKLGWMAGIVDMKGRTRRVISPIRRTPLMILMVESSHLEIVRRLSQLTGTRPEYTKPKVFTDTTRRGCSEHCPEPHQHVSPRMPSVGRWHITGAGAAIVLDNLMPHLLNKDGFDEFIAEIIACIPTNGRGRHAINLSIARLARMGWTIPVDICATGAIEVKS